MHSATALFLLAGIAAAAPAATQNPRPFIADTVDALFGNVEFGEFKANQARGDSSLFNANTANGKNVLELKFADAKGNTGSVKDTLDTASVLGNSILNLRDDSNLHASASASTQEADNLADSVNSDVDNLQLLTALNQLLDSGLLKRDGNELASLLTNANGATDAELQDSGNGLADLLDQLLKLTGKLTRGLNLDKFNL